MTKSWFLKDSSPVRSLYTWREPLSCGRGSESDVCGKAFTLSRDRRERFAEPGRRIRSSQDHL
jgi:hypothetical protein